MNAYPDIYRATANQRTVTFDGMDVCVYHKGKLHRQVALIELVDARFRRPTRLTRGRVRFLTMRRFQAPPVYFSRQEWPAFQVLLTAILERKLNPRAPLPPVLVQEYVPSPEPSRRHRLGDPVDPWSQAPLG